MKGPLIIQNIRYTIATFSPNPRKKKKKNHEQTRKKPPASCTWSAFLRAPIHRYRALIHPRSTRVTYRALMKF